MSSYVAHLFEFLLGALLAVGSAIELSAIIAHGVDRKMAILYAVAFLGGSLISVYGFWSFL